MTQSELLDFMRGHRWAVQTSVSGAGAPQAALVGIAVTDDLEIVFDTLDIMQQIGMFPRSKPPRALMQLIVALQRLGRRGPADKGAS